MQRFKKEYNARCGRNWPTIRRFNHASDEHGKFVYGSNGTLTQAARWRDEGFKWLAIAASQRKRYPDVARANLNCAGGYIKNSRPECRLPA